MQANGAQIAAMDRLDDEDIGAIWRRHYSRRIYSDISRSLCTSLAMILRLRAQPRVSHRPALPLEFLLETANIPKNEFDTVITESIGSL